MWEIILIALVILLVFGVIKLPQLFKTFTGEMGLTTPLPEDTCVLCEKKIDELITEVNTIKDALSGDDFSTEIKDTTKWNMWKARTLCRMKAGKSGIAMRDIYFNVGYLQEKLKQNNFIKEFLHKGGLRCEILTSGKINVGDIIK